MHTAWKWALGVLAVALVTFLIATSLFGGFGRMGYSCGGFSMMGPQFGGMFGGWGMFGGLMMLGMFLIPLGVLALLVLGGIALVRSISMPRTSVPAGVTCPSCGRPVQNEWTTCPYCGKPLH